MRHLIHTVPTSPEFDSRQCTLDGRDLDICMRNFSEQEQLLLQSFLLPDAKFQLLEIRLFRHGQPMSLKQSPGSKPLHSNDE
jgi:hypothetical protein